MSITAPRIFGWRAPEEESADASWTQASPIAAEDRTRLEGAIGQLDNLALIMRQPADSTPPPSPPGEKPAPQARAPRQRTLLSGVISFAGGARSLHCIIRDLSDIGARVRVDGLEGVPNTVWLIDVRRGVAFEARVAWSKGRELGLAFEQMQPLGVDCPPEMKGLRRLWLERLPR